MVSAPALYKEVTEAPLKGRHRRAQQPAAAALLTKAGEAGRNLKARARRSVLAHPGSSSCYEGAFADYKSQDASGPTTTRDELPVVSRMRRGGPIGNGARRVRPAP